jgi:hypothetical protein
MSSPSRSNPNPTAKTTTPQSLSKYQIGGFFLNPTDPPVFEAGPLSGALSGP